MAIEAVVERLSSEALNKAVTKADDIAKQAPQGSSFKDTLSAMEDSTNFANMIGMDPGQDISPAAQMQTLEADAIEFTPTQETTSLSKPEASEKILDMLGEVNKGQMQMDSLVNHVLYSGKKFSNQELLVIQAHVFHFAQMTELTVKVAEQGVSSVKSVLNTQIQ